MSADYDPLPADDGGVVVLPDDWRDDAWLLASLERSTPLELVKRRVELAHDSVALRKEMRRLSRLLVERVSRPQGSEWLNVDEAARLLSMSRKALYVARQRAHPSSALAQASSRIGRRLRFSRSALEELLRTRSPSLSSTRQAVLMRPRDTSPARSGR